MREEATPWSSAAFAAAAGITAAACDWARDRGRRGQRRASRSGGKRGARWPPDVMPRIKVGWKNIAVSRAGGSRRDRGGGVTHPEERLLEESAAVAGGDVLGEGRLDLHLVLGAELGRGGDHRVTELLLGVGAGGAEHLRDAGRGVGARGDAGGDAGGAKVRGSHGGGHFDLSRSTSISSATRCDPPRPLVECFTRLESGPSTWRNENAERVPTRRSSLNAHRGKKL